MNIANILKKITYVIQTIITSICIILASTQDIVIPQYVFMMLGGASSVLHVIAFYSDNIEKVYKEMSMKLEEVNEKVSVISSSNSIASREIQIPAYNPEPIAEQAISERSHVPSIVPSLTFSQKTTLSEKVPVRAYYNKKSQELEYTQETPR